MCVCVFFNRLAMMCVFYYSMCQTCKCNTIYTFFHVITHHLFSLAIIYQMENTEKSTEPATSAVSIDLEYILKRLDSMSNCIDQLACMYECLTHFSPFTTLKCQ